MYNLAVVETSKTATPLASSYFETFDSVTEFSALLRGSALRGTALPFVTTGSYNIHRAEYHAHGLPSRLRRPFLKLVLTSLGVSREHTVVTSAPSAVCLSTARFNGGRSLVDRATSRSLFLFALDFNVILTSNLMSRSVM